MSDSAPEPVAQGQLNRTSKSQVTAPYKPTQAYFRPDTGEVLFVPLEDAAEFEAHGFAMTKIIHDLHKANEKVSQCVASYGQVMSSPDPAARAGAQKAYDSAVAAQKKAAAVVKGEMEKLEPLAKLSPGGSSIVELIPLSKRGAGGKSRQYNAKIVHVKSNNIKKAGWRAFPLDREQRPTSRNRNVPGSQANDPNGGENIITEVGGKRKVDMAKLGKQLKEFKPEVKAELWKKEHAQGILFEWAEAMNKDLKWEHQGIGKKFTNNVDFTAQAQLMRYLAATGAEAVWDPKAGKMGLKAEAKAEFSLAEGKFSMALYAPHRLGWVLQFTSPTSGKIYPLGAIRAQLEFVAAGVVGASVVAELSSEIECSALKIGIKGAPPAAPPAPVNPNAGPSVSGKAITVAPAKVEVGAFAGAKADADLAGSIQWLNPENKEKKFEDFVKIAPGVSAMAGAGASLKLEISYRNGKFVMVMQASLCLGLGARGKLACEADAVKIGTFIYWFYYQLYNANFEFMVFVTRRAFEAIQNIQFLVIQSGKKAAEFLDKTTVEIAARVDSVLSIMDKSQERDALADRILKNPDMLRVSTPETKGMLLYQLTRHGKPDWVDPGNYEGFDAFAKRKKAVLRVLQYVQTVHEWKNVFQHMHPTGGKTNGSHYLTVERFLKLGIDDMDDDLHRIERRLKTQPARGYPVVANNTLNYSLFDGEHPQFASATLDPLSPLDVSHYA